MTLLANAPAAASAAGRAFEDFQPEAAFDTTFADWLNPDETDLTGLIDALSGGESSLPRGDVLGTFDWTAASYTTNHDFLSLA